MCLYAWVLDVGRCADLVPVCFGVNQIWLEDSKSIAEKVKLIKKYKLAGVAEWKLGFENSGIWSVITENLS